MPHQSIQYAPHRFSFTLLKRANLLLPLLLLLPKTQIPILIPIRVLIPTLHLVLALLTWMLPPPMLS